MKLIKPLVGISLLSFFIWISSTQLSGCKKKTDIIHDTVTVYDTQDGLVAWYTFNGGSLADGSGFNNNLTNNGATATTDRFGNANNAYLFNGTSSFLTAANSNSLNPVGGMTMMAIIKINGFYAGTCHANQVIGKGYPDNINGYYVLRFTDPNTSCTATLDPTHEHFYGAYGDDNPQGAAASASEDTVLLQTGKWYNVVYTYDGLVSKLYMNGVLKGSFTKSAPFTANNHNLFIGKHEDPTYPYYFNGVIDEVRIYNRALPPGAITQLNNLKQ